MSPSRVSLTPSAPFQIRLCAEFHIDGEGMEYKTQQLYVTTSDAMSKVRVQPSATAPMPLPRPPVLTISRVATGAIQGSTASALSRPRFQATGGRWGCPVMLPCECCPVNAARGRWGRPAARVNALHTSARARKDRLRARRDSDRLRQGETDSSDGQSRGWRLGLWGGEGSTALDLVSCLHVTMHSETHVSECR